MSDALVRTISQRLSLRAPQADSLEILAGVLGQLELSKNADLAVALAAIRTAYARVEDFEREFPSLCFALATGVGKTRLMGAFIAYLYLSARSRHFFVLAPNKTIYDKLISDFSPASPKYVFPGIAEFSARPPLIITGENYESGIGVRLDSGRSTDLFGSDVHINIFNIDKINREESPHGRPRMRALQETIGDSYYDYLAQRDDLVIIMDEAHRYRASAGARAIDGLRPILGIELTATPRTVGAQSVPFRNVIYSYSLGQAMTDGFVKEPAVATRANFDPKSVSAEKLEQIKLEDAVHYHDHVAVELDRYHRVSGQKKVHPFILVVAQDTAHASRLKAFIESEAFFEARFKNKVIEVHSALRGSESDDAMERLIALETDDRTEIVIHVNKLKEGWDVTNLYTIVPLRASASDILTEQTLGRGLRLPFGRRVTKSDDDEFAAVDRLTVIAHERFDELIARAREADSIIKFKEVLIGEGGDVPLTGSKLVDVPSYAETLVTGSQPSMPGFTEIAQPPTFATPAETQAATATLQVIQRYERKLGSAQALRSDDVQRQISADVREIVRPVQGTLEVVGPAADIEKVVRAVTEIIAEKTISIPQIIVIPKRQIAFRFDDFDLVSLETVRYRPIDDELVIQNLRTEARVYLAKPAHEAREARMEDYLVRYLIEKNEIDYDAHADLIYKLCGQLVAHIRSYLATDAEVENVLLYHGRTLSDFVFAQMMQHYRETPLGDDDYEVRVTRGFMLLRPQPFNVPKGQAARDFRQAVVPLGDTRRQVFGGFKLCCYPLQRFQSDPERRFAVLVDAEATVKQWMKPGQGQFRIEYRSGEPYEPDFIVETSDRMLICEVKARNEMDDGVVKDKATAARKWCESASAHARQSGGKLWTYAMIPDDQIVGAASLDGLIARFSNG